MNLIELLSNKDVLINVLVVALVVIVIAILLYTKRTEQAKKIILALVLEAEQKFGNGTGDKKYAYVIGLVYPKLPTVIKFFVTEKQLDIWIEDAVTYLKLELQATKTK